jgi:hypothetical protein
MLIMVAVIYFADMKPIVTIDQLLSSNR